MTSPSHRYAFDPTWGKMPTGTPRWGSVPGVAVDSQDRIYVLHRSASPLVIYNQAGDILRTWGDDFPKTAHWRTNVDWGAHGCHIQKEADGEYIYFTDTLTHFVMKCTLDGREVWSMTSTGGPHNEDFNQPTDITVTPDGDFYVSDGYGNFRVHHFDPNRKHIKSWGEKGTGASQFSLVHDVWFDTRGGKRRLWVVDRENNRIQIFTPEGEFVEEKTGFRRPNGIWVDPQGYMYVAELLGRVSILDANDRVVATLGGEQSLEPGRLMNPHAVWGDSQGNLYIGEVDDGARVQKFIRTR
jgi:DNA-binding beta-propeller fold protein YncE